MDNSKWVQTNEIKCIFLARNPNKRVVDGDYTEKYIWPEHTPKNREYLILDANESRVESGPRAKKCAFWMNFLPKLIESSRKRIVLQTTLILIAISFAFRSK